MKTKIKNLISNLFRSKDKFRTEFLIDIPDHLAPMTIYIIGENNFYSFAYLKCPCGCNKLIQLCLIPDEHPYWKIKWHINGTLTLYPSIWRTDGCRSHFLLRKGKIKWVKNSY